MKLLFAVNGEITSLNELIAAIHNQITGINALLLQQGALQLAFQQGGHRNLSKCIICFNHQIIKCTKHTYLQKRRTSR
jgi:hypothetical protein